MIAAEAFVRNVLKNRFHPALMAFTKSESSFSKKERKKERQFLRNREHTFNNAAYKINKKDVAGMQ